METRSARLVVATLAVVAALAVAGQAVAQAKPAAKPVAKPVAAAAAAAPAAASATPAATAPASGSAAAALLPGIVSKDTNPNGCVSCHTGAHTVGKELAAIKHKNVDAKTKNVPADCKSCHDEDSDMGSLQQVIHMSHYGEGAQAEFVKEHGGQCLHCHAIDVKTGDAKVKGGAKNW